MLVWWCGVVWNVCVVMLMVMYMMIGVSIVSGNYCIRLEMMLSMLLMLMNRLVSSV